MMSELAGVMFNSLFSAMVVFIFASGLTLLFGVLRILNFSQGGFFAIGAYLAFSTTRMVGTALSLWLFLVIAIVAGGAVGRWASSPNGWCGGGCATSTAPAR